jgi:2-polyprenyl-6-methoxyphenol hydroxylase-like FAD-dependent oxidoreductase
LHQHRHSYCFMSGDAMNAISESSIVGAGSVGSLTALTFQQRRWDVEIWNVVRVSSPKSVWPALTPSFRYLRKIRLTSQSAICKEPASLMDNIHIPMPCEYPMSSIHHSNLQRRDLAAAPLGLSRMRSKLVDITQRCPRTFRSRLY